MTFSRPYPRWLDPRRFDRDSRLSESPARPLLDYASPSSWRRTAESIARGNPAAVVVPWWTSFWGPPVRAVFRALGSAAGSPLRLLICHNVEDHEPSLVKRFLATGAFSAAEAFLVHSEENRRELARRYPSRPIACIRLPVLELADTTREEARVRLGLERERPLVLFLGLIRAYKGVDLLLEAAPRLVREMGALVAIVGEVFPDARDLARRKEASPVSADILWKDEYVSEEEMALWLAACDVVALPYRRISGSAIAARAIAARRPIAAADVGGLRDAVVPGSTGELFAAGDADGLAGAVARILANGAERYREGLERAARENSWPAYARRLLQFVESVRCAR